MWNYDRLPARFGHAGAWLIIYVNERSYRGASVPVSLAALSIFLNVSERRVRDIVDEVIGLGAMSRDPDHYWRLRTHPERFEDAPLKPPECRPRNSQALAEELHSGESAVEAPSVNETVITATSEIDFTEPLVQLRGAIDCAPAETDFPPRETYCPWGWECPHLLN